MKTIILTGGHPAPLIAMSQQLQERGYSIVVMGRDYVFSEAQNVQSFEKRAVTKLNIPFLSIPVRRFPSSIFGIFPFIASFISSVLFVQKQIALIKPALVLSFGGYVSMPVGLIAALGGIPIVIHDQTIRAGRANRFLAFFARKICISWKETRRDFLSVVGNKIELTGNPMRHDFLKNVKSIHYFSEKLPLVYITGGSAGSHVINKSIEKVLPELLKKFTIIHQTGDSHFNDYERLQKVHKKLPPILQQRYLLTKYLDADQINSCMRSAYCVIGRSGANTTIEIAVVGVPAIFIPLPYSQYNEQEALAKKVEKAGSAIIIPQVELTGEKIQSALERIKKTYKKYYENAQQFRQSEEITVHQNAVFVIADIIEHILDSNRDMVS